jgi:hypothetical protein
MADGFTVLAESLGRAHGWKFSGAGHFVKNRPAALMNIAQAAIKTEANWVRKESRQ